jgi:hypothetical protein
VLGLDNQRPKLLSQSRHIRVEDADRRRHLPLATHDHKDGRPGSAWSEKKKEKERQGKFIVKFIIVFLLLRKADD